MADYHVHVSCLYIYMQHIPLCLTAERDEEDMSTVLLESKDDATVSACVSITAREKDHCFPGSGLGLSDEGAEQGPPPVAPSLLPTPHDENRVSPNLNCHWKTSI